MGDLSVFVDESGNIGSDSVYYCIALVLHDQSESADSYIEPYLSALTNASLADIPFHLTPLIRAHDLYKHLDVSTRKQYLAAFRVFAEHFPFRYGIFRYLKHQFEGVQSLQRRMERDISLWIEEHLAFFQQFDRVKIYYDDGQKIVTDSVHRAFERSLAHDAIIYKDAVPTRFRLLQLADYVCGVELLDEKFAQHRETVSDVMFFGKKTSFQKNFLRKIRKHRL